MGGCGQESQSELNSENLMSGYQQLHRQLARQRALTPTKPTNYSEAQASRNLPALHIYCRLSLFSTWYQPRLSLLLSWAVDLDR